MATAHKQLVVAIVNCITYMKFSLLMSWNLKSIQVVPFKINELKFFRVEFSTHDTNFK